MYKSVYVQQKKTQQKENRKQKRIKSIKTINKKSIKT